SMPFPLSFAQQRLWFLERLRPGDASYHIPLALTIRGPIAFDRLAAAVGEVLDRHEALRTVFIDDAGEPKQCVIQQPKLPFEVRDRSGVDDASLRAEARELVARPFDIERGPLLRVVAFMRSRDTVLLVAVMHHLVADGASIPIFLQELSDAYRALGHHTA